MKIHTKLIVTFILFTMSRISISQNNPTVIVLCAPSVNEPYYAQVFDSIIKYDILFVNKVNTSGTDRAIILADNATIPYLKTGLTDSVIVQSDVADIWMRDFSPVETSNRVKFDYRPDYLSHSDADFIDNSFRNWFGSIGLIYNTDSPLILDGGNLAWNRAGKAILTNRVFSDNPGYTVNQVDAILKSLLNIQEIAYLPEEAGDLTGHSDGMVMFVDTNKVFVNTYTDAIFRNEVLNALTTGLPGINITEVPYNYDTTLWQGWPSACGIFLNSLVTENYIYMPVYNMPDDAFFFNLIQSNTSKTVIPVNASNVCYMGGSVRCLTWAVTGNDAQTLLHIANPASVMEPNDKEISCRIYPNPSASNFTIEFSERMSNPFVLTITDLTGRLILRKADIKDNKVIIDKGDIAPGIYTIQALDGKGYINTNKLVIE